MSFSKLQTSVKAVQHIYDLRWLNQYQAGILRWFEMPIKHPLNFFWFCKKPSVGFEHNFTYVHIYTSPNI